ncbi:hypothetical protein HPB47_009843 [Ixodes persulcatus]|uniref:Uncharacterized protein n=1 Tax=Ixodes persulcatus TaxID=34615 RepID=A0AC60P103_IXOPE|nr:hypothetical protein HPB47_009843 [Ixodes persulcatus]
MLADDCHCESFSLLLLSAPQFETKKTTRNRAPNFTEREKDALLDLVEEFKNIVESKTTDKIITKTKNRVWDRITLKFNAVMGARREAHQLKKCYETIKKKARKDLAANRLAVRATGGGPCPTPLSRTTERLTAFIGPLQEPLPNRFDSDAVPSEGQGPAGPDTNDSSSFWKQSSALWSDALQADPASTGTQQAREEELRCCRCHSHLQPCS